MKFHPHALAAVALALIWMPVQAQQSLTWDELKTRFEAANPQLRADELSVDEMKAEETTAHLRPNPQLTVGTDGTQIARHNGVWQPLSGTDVQSSFSYLHERDHKRDLRQESAKQGTQITALEHEDLKRNMLFNLRTLYVQTLQAKEVLRLAKDDLAYYDHIIEISNERFKAGDLAQIDLDRIELLRVQYESELEQAAVNLRTSKIQLQQMLNDKTPVEQFDVVGLFEFSPELKQLEDYRQMALDARPDLRAALKAVEQAQTNHKLAEANGSTDPTFSSWYTWNASNNNPNANQTLGLSVSVPLRIFDRNQGEKQRTLIDIDRNKQLTDAARAQVFSDVDSAYAQVQSNINLLKPYKAKYNDQALRVRDTVTYSYEHGSASLMDFLNAQSDFRQVQLAYAQLIGSYLTAAGQLNLAAGSEVLP
ncbi:TolC family protein [Telmatobacter bradus]|uniref:TolC family protein n=1 Tax=Telmatobacter bradus TaxID=474953 RepID=UPI003B43739E